MKIAAVCGSLVAAGNVKTLLDHALEEYAGSEHFEVVRFNLFDMEVGPCRHCNWCLNNQRDGRYCAVDDDMSRVYPELIEAAGLIVASPVHFGRLSGATADFLDRLRIFVHGNLTRGLMRNKVGGALAVAWFRNAGIEMTLLTITANFDALGMVIASPDLGMHGGSAYSSLDGTGRTVKGDRLLVERDEMGKASARSLAYRVGELATLLEAGKHACSENL